ncbi:MAG TPA: hypothetical protein VG603_00070, partial [Chitinophagales bacterium]|nr:hypothetical protein [Chitinophagales bacterium]
MRRLKFTLFLTALLTLPHLSFCTGEAGTYFNIFVPPSNETEGRDVALVVTAINDNTHFNIDDTGEDGDT